MPRARSIALLAAAAFACWSGPAAASVWTTVPTQTTDDITALSYPSDAGISFATAQGRIYARQGDGSFAPQLNVPGRQFTDLAYNPSGTVGLATADSGKLYRYANGSWGLVPLTNASYTRPGSGDFCLPSPGAALPAATPSATLLATAWSSDTVAWVVSAADGQILKSVDAGKTFKDVSRRANGTCALPAAVTDVAPVADNDVFFVQDDFARIWRTSDGLASATLQPAVSLVNCFDARMRLAVDAGRISAVGPCFASALHWGVSPDGGVTGDYVTSPSTGPLRATAIRGGTLLAVGDGGTIEQSLNGSTSRSFAAGIAPTWNAVSMLDASHAAVAGSGGALAVTSMADEAPMTHPQITHPTPTPTPAPTPTPTPTPPVVIVNPPVSITAPGTIAKVSGGKVVVTVRGKLSGACAGTVTLTVKKGRTLLTARNAKVARTCRFVKSISLSRAKVGSAKTLKVTLRFHDRTKTLTVKVRH